VDLLLQISLTLSPRRRSPKLRSSIRHGANLGPVRALSRLMPAFPVRERTVGR
jgi:hypothetical protein